MNPAAIVELAPKIGPQLVKLVVKWLPVLLNKDNQRLAKQLQELFRRLAEAQKARSREERLRRTLGVVKDQAQKLESGAADESAAAQARVWVQQADSLLGALALLKVRDGRQQRAGLKRISKEVDLLFTAVMEATMTADPPHEDPDVQFGSARSA